MVRAGKPAEFTPVTEEQRASMAALDFSAMRSIVSDGRSAIDRDKMANESVKGSLGRVREDRTEDRLVPRFDAFLPSRRPSRSEWAMPGHFALLVRQLDSSATTTSGLKNATMIMAIAAVAASTPTNASRDHR